MRANDTEHFGGEGNGQFSHQICVVDCRFRGGSAGIDARITRRGPRRNLEQGSQTRWGFTDEVV
jgi:hypothetical protein